MNKRLHHTHVQALTTLQLHLYLITLQNTTSQTSKQKCTLDRSPEHQCFNTYIILDFPCLIACVFFNYNSVVTAAPHRCSTHTLRVVVTIIKPFQHKSDSCWNASQRQQKPSSTHGAEVVASSPCFVKPLESTESPTSIVLRLLHQLDDHFEHLID